MYAVHRNGTAVLVAQVEGARRPERYQSLTALSSVTKLRSARQA
jgi:hypothetical protein